MNTDPDGELNAIRLYLLVEVDCRVFLIEFTNPDTLDSEFGTPSGGG